MTKQNPKVKRLFVLTEEVESDLSRTATETGKSKSEIVREALDKYITERDEKEDDGQ